MKRLMQMVLLSSLAAAFVFAGKANAQERTEEIRFGFFGGVNYNLVGAGATNLVLIPGDPDFILSEVGGGTEVNDGRDLGYYAGLFGEYNTGRLLGLQLRLGIDTRGAVMEDQNEAVEFETDISYVSIEPGVRFNFMPGLALTAGPGIAVLLDAKYDYDPDDTQGDLPPSIEDQQLENMNNIAFSLWGDIGYDITLKEGTEKGGSTVSLTPFLGASWLVDQKKPDVNTVNNDQIDDTWSTVTVRGGLQLKFGVVQ